MKLSGTPIWKLYAPRVFASRVGATVMFPNAQLVYHSSQLLNWSISNRLVDVDIKAGQIMTKKLKDYLSNTKSRYNCVNVALYDGPWMHANILIYDTLNQTAVLYDPNGQCLDEECRRFVDDMEPFLEGFCRQLGYSFTVRTNDSCPRLGMQTVYEVDCLERLKGQVGYCATWIYIFMEFRIRYPDLGYKALEEFIIANNGCDILDMVFAYQIKVDLLFMREYPQFYQEMQTLPKTSPRYLRILEQMESDYQRHLDPIVSDQDHHH